MGCGLSKAHHLPEVLVSHRNARTTFHGRLLIVQRSRAGWPQAHIAAAMGISRKCVRLWLDRYAAEGEAGLRDRSSRPHAIPTRTSAVVEQQVLAARGQSRRGQDFLGRELGLAPRTVGRILRRHHVPYLRELDPMTGTLLRTSKVTATRYERARPGELVHVDVKKLGASPMVAGGARMAAPKRSGPEASAMTTSIPWLMIIPGLLTARSCPMRRGSRARPSLPALLNTLHHRALRT